MKKLTGKTHSPTGEDGSFECTEIILDLSGSIVANTYPVIARTLHTIYRDAGATGTVGLVVFSDTAVEALPPGTPARELLLFLRYFELRHKGARATYPDNPWTQSLVGGTAISTGIEAARQALQRDRAGGHVILISDLGDNLNDKRQLKGELIQLRTHVVQ